MSCPPFAWLPLDRLSGRVCRCTKLSAFLSSSVSRHPLWTQPPLWQTTRVFWGPFLQLGSPHPALNSVFSCCPSGMAVRVSPGCFTSSSQKMCFSYTVPAQWITPSPVWNLEGVLEIKKTVYLAPPFDNGNCDLCFNRNSFSSWKCERTELSV